MKLAIVLRNPDWQTMTTEWEKEFRQRSFTKDRRLWIMGILSDVQELIRGDNLKMADEWLNKAKYHLIRLVDEP
jgi:hypothetical protein